jgi:hypothetical protein
VVAGGLGAGEARAADADNLPPNVPEWMKTPGDATGSQLYGTPSPFEKNVVKNIPKNLKQYLSASGHHTRVRICSLSSADVLSRNDFKYLIPRHVGRVRDRPLASAGTAVHLLARNLILFQRASTRTPCCTIRENTTPAAQATTNSPTSMGYTCSSARTAASCGGCLSLRASEAIASAIIRGNAR